MKTSRLLLTGVIPMWAFAWAVSAVSAAGIEGTASRGTSDVIRWQAPPVDAWSEGLDDADARLGFSSGYIFHEHGWGDGRAGLGAGLSYRLSPGLSVSFGGYLQEPGERGATSMPMFFFDWRIDDHWSVRTSNGLRLSYDVSADRRHLLSADVAWESDDLSYRAPWVDSSWPFNPGAEPALRASLAWQWNLGHHFAVRPEVSYRFARSVELRGQHGPAPAPVSTGAFAIGATVSARF